MDPKTSEWRPGPTVCRCCLTEGCYKDISTEYFWMGKREVYAEMLSDTFNVAISFSQSGGPNSNSRLICEPCISRLRDASDFKRQVQECEKTFMHHLDPGASSIVDDLVEPQETDVKLEQVKLEKRLSDDEFIDHTDFIDDDDDDDLDDQPLTKLATRLPKKESVDLLDLLDNAKPSEKRKSSTKLKATSSKKAKLAKIVKKESVKAATSKVSQKTEKKKKEIDPLVEARQNAKLLMKYSTAYPFRIPSNDMVCVYCCEAFEDPKNYREHMRIEHPIFNVKTAFAHTMSSQEFLKVDCTEIECRLCAEKFDTIRSVAEHLMLVHDKKFNLNAEIGVQVFKLGQERWVCAMCPQKFPCLRALSRHNSFHYHKYTCETCGKSYISRENLNKHILYGHSQQKICVKCKQSFPDCETRREHILASKRCWPFGCNMCGERFTSRKLKTYHMAEAHEQRSMKFHTCPECNQIFNEWRMYRTHFIISHTDNNYVCSFCDLKFASKRDLEEHKVIHTKEKLFPCTFCTKSFVRKKNLMQHLWIHSEQKRFECKLCNKQFNQRVSWKTHMRAYHQQIVHLEHCK